LSALSDETRLSVVGLLVQAGVEGMSAGDIAETLQSKQNTMSSQLKVLSQARLITSRREGRHIRYRADYDAIRRLILYLMEDCSQGRPEVCRPVAGSLSIS
jgi:DNA-binding transcriptional ArsR family regulator